MNPPGRSKDQPILKQVLVSITPSDLDYLVFATKWLGISKAEFVRRLLTESRIQWAVKGLYPKPWQETATKNPKPQA